MNQLKTERISFIPADPKFSQDINKLILNSFDQLHQFMPWAKNKPSLQDTLHVLQNLKEENEHKKALHFFIQDNSTKALIGSCGCPRLDWSIPRFEIGYWLATQEQGKGYMTEAVRYLTSYLKEKFSGNRIEIHCDRQNSASARVAERAGYTLEAVLKNHRRTVQDQLSDTLIYTSF